MAPSAPASSASATSVGGPRVFVVVVVAPASPGVTSSSLVIIGSVSFFEFSWSESALTDFFQ